MEKGPGAGRTRKSCGVFRRQGTSSRRTQPVGRHIFCLHSLETIIDEVDPRSRCCEVQRCRSRIKAHSRSRQSPRPACSVDDCLQTRFTLAVVYTVAFYPLRQMTSSRTTSRLQFSIRTQVCLPPTFHLPSRTENQRTCSTTHWAPLYHRHCGHLCAVSPAGEPYPTRSVRYWDR